MTEIKLAVSNLGMYQEGNHVWEWLTLPATQEEIEATLQAIHVDQTGNGRYESYMISDFESPFEIGLYDNIEKWNDVAEKLEELDDEQIEIVKILLDNGIVEDLDSAIENLDNVTVWCDCDDMSDVAYETYSSTGQLETIPDHVKNYIDWDAMGRDMEIEGSYYEMTESRYLETFI